MLEHIIAGLAAAGIRRICAVIGYRGDQIVEHLGDGGRLGAELHYVRQEKPGGTGDALLCAADFIGGDGFFLGWGDIMVPPANYRAIAAVHEAEGPEALLSVNYVDDPWEGAAVYVTDRHVERIVEKPPRGTASTNFNNAGLFIFQPGIIEILRNTPLSPRGELEVPSAIQTLLERGTRIRAYQIEGYWSDVARPAETLRIGAEIIRARSRAGILIHPDARVSRSAQLHPPVLIGPGVRIDAAQVGPNVCLMAGSAVGAGAMLTQVAAYPHASVGRGCRLTHSIVEECVQVPDDAVVNGTASEVRVLEGA